MEIKKLKVKDLKYAPYNPRKISEEMLEKLKRSIKEFGYVEPVIVNQRNMQVVGGNQRLKVLKDLGIEEVKAVIVDLDDTKEKTLNIALNRINGEWDYPKLKDLFEELDTGTFNMELTGFDEEEMEKIIVNFGDFANDEKSWDYPFGTINSWIRIGDFTCEIEDKKYNVLKSKIEKSGGIDRFIDELCIE